MGGIGPTGPAGAFGHSWAANAGNQGPWVVNNVGAEVSMGFQFTFVPEVSGRLLLMVSGTCGNTLAANRNIIITGRWNETSVMAAPGPWEDRPAFMGKIWGVPQTLIVASPTERKSFLIMGTIPQPFNGQFDPDSYPPLPPGQSCWLDLSIQDPQGSGSSSLGAFVADVQFMVLEL
jgi:hypothetical protein